MSQPGWNLSKGELLQDEVTEEKYWALFNYLFSDNSKKRSTYKFGLIKSIMDNLFNCVEDGKGYLLNYDYIFEKFTENYWNLVIKYNLSQIRTDGRSDKSQLESILIKASKNNSIVSKLEYSSIESDVRREIASDIKKACKKYVMGALYKDFEGVLYDFNNAEERIIIKEPAYKFMVKYKKELEIMNYYSWAKLLEKINPEDMTSRLLDKLELATPKRNNLSVYCQILFEEFQECNCFYCGKKLNKSIHVDHFIPWSFVKDDKIWNFILTCPSCNMKKSNKLPNYEFVIRIERRNELLNKSKNLLVEKDLATYSQGAIERMWEYARLGGYKEVK